jgi:hypothetical protein
MIAVFDTLGLDNSLARSRTLIAAAAAATRLLEARELEARILRLETAVDRRPPAPIEIEDIA